MKVFIGNVTPEQSAKLLVALYNNIAVAKKYSPLGLMYAGEMLLERKNDIRYLNSIYLGVNFNVTDGFIDLTKYNRFIDTEFNKLIPYGQDVVKNHSEEIGIAWVKPEKLSTPSLSDACATQKTFTVLASSQGNVVQRFADSANKEPTQIVHNKYDAKTKFNPGC